MTGEIKTRSDYDGADRPDSQSLQFGERAKEDINQASDQIGQLIKAWDERLTLKNLRLGIRAWRTT
jgi:hypothetical protein